MKSIRTALALMIVFAAACGDSQTPPLPEAEFTARGSVEQVWLVEATPGEELRLVASDGSVVETGLADELGSRIFRKVPIGEDYRVEAGAGADRRSTGPLSVRGPDDTPPYEFYANQEIGPGYGYIETRDGTLLAVNVILPGPTEDGPYPTVIEYSGYSPADPENPQPSMLIASVRGYAVVGVNMRGTGCSGGSFDFFETLQTTDGYDAVETIAAQSWVLDNEVGMVGLSYPGISQLFVAQRQPPSLNSIAPNSVIADTGRSVLRAGGILNTVFAVPWAEDRARDSKPGGQRWSQKRLDEGDEICQANMALRGQTPDIIDAIDRNEFYDATVADPLSPRTFVDKIEVPLLLAGAWQDEQTGSDFANMLDRFTGTPDKRFVMTNGVHTEPLGPEILCRWMVFQDLFVKKQIPGPAGTEQLILDVLGGQIFGLPGLALPENCFPEASSYEEALANWRNEPTVQILFDNGGAGRPGEPISSFEVHFDQWPAREAEPRAWYLDEDGRLTGDEPGAAGEAQFQYDPSFAQVGTVVSGSPWLAQPAYEWPYRPADTSLTFETGPLARDQILMGSASVDLFIRANAPDVDLQAVVSEIRPDGQETYIGFGLLRASRRQLDELASTELRPVHTHLREDAAPLPEGEWSEVRIEIFPFAHALRAGSRIRVSIQAPGGIRPEWKFEALEYDTPVTTRVAFGADLPSRVVFGVVEGVDIPTDLPAPGALRGQPTRQAR
jgi:predicted acyl esterase